MNTSIPTHTTAPTPGADVLAFGFGTAASTWCVGYVTHLPILEFLPPAAISISAGIGIITVLLAAGWLFGKTTTRTWRGALGTATLTALINMLVVSAVLADAEDYKTLAIGLPGYLIASVVLFSIGSVVGKAGRRAEHTTTQHNWLMWFVLSALVATVLVIIAGGLVTGHDAGFSVEDWPTSKQANMFLYPLSKMTGGIYYEHTHRLFGTLVGLTTLALTCFVWSSRVSRGVKVLTTVCFVSVVLQGVMGGLWVLSEGKSLASILFHGSFGQMIGAALVVLAAMTTASWSKPDARVEGKAATTDRVLGVITLLFVIIQLLLGVLLRKEYNVLMEHIGFAFVTAGLALAVSVRASAIYGETSATLKRVGNAVSVVVIAQIGLGFIALAVRDTSQPKPQFATDQVSDPVDAFITTLHQTTGAALLALVALLVAWQFRLLRTARTPQEQSVQDAAAYDV